MRFSGAEQIREGFERVYGKIHCEKFQDLPIANPALSVKVVGIRETEDLFTFALLTPWMLNQVAVPKLAEVRSESIRSMRRDRLEELGDFFVSNRVSPMGEFTSMDDAVRAAEGYAEELFGMATRKSKEGPPDRSRQEPLPKFADKKGES